MVPGNEAAQRDAESGEGPLTLLTVNASSSNVSALDVSYGAAHTESWGLSTRCCSLYGQAMLEAKGSSGSGKTDIWLEPSLSPQLSPKPPPESLS